MQEQLSSAQAEVDRAQAEQRALGEKKARVPHFWNLNEDPSLSGMIHHFLDGGRSKREYLLGNARANGELKPDIPIFGIRCASPNAWRYGLFFAFLFRITLICTSTFTL